MAASSTEHILLGWLRNLPTNHSGREITADTSLIEGGLLDSVGILELVSFVEETFALILPLDEFIPENFSTPASIVSMIGRLRQAAVLH